MSNQKFIGCDSDYKHADIVLFGAPYDGTVSFREGASGAPEAIRASSDDAIETFSPYQDKDLDDLYVYDFGDLTFAHGSPEKMVETVEQCTREIIADDKLPVMIGGEHLVTLGAVSALYEKYPDLHIITLDAHADLRDEYLGQRLSHATVMRRVYDVVGSGRLFQFGIRSGERTEFEWAKKYGSLHKFDFSDIATAIYQTSGSPVYLSIDLDVLDPATLPGTGTPEAGGVSFDELLDAIIKLSDCNIVGADITELSPPCDTSGVSTIVACKVLRELLVAIG
ncbi:MAG: agmatinase [Clostridia bacterium]|jgi:agmatinase|nr:agmatinase [Clostridia bacterium]MBT7122665.1 agmatinase [Clostridia bacterium]